MDWRSRGMCRNVDPELFFPVGRGEQARLQTREAKAVCRGCPVLVQCAEWVLTTGADQDNGIWAGMDPDERRVARRSKKTLSEFVEV